MPSLPRAPWQETRCASHAAWKRKWEMAAGFLLAALRASCFQRVLAGADEGPEASTVSMP